MRILFISDRLPDKLRDGGSLRTFHILRGLAREHEVTVLSHGDGIPSLESFRAQFGVARIVLVPRMAGWQRVFDGIFSGRLWSQPLFVVKNWSEPLLSEADRLLATGEFDAVHFNHLDVACLALERSWPQPMVFDTHNCLSSMVRDMSNGSGARYPRFIYRREARMLYDLESAVCRRMNLILACSQDDAAAFAEMSGVPWERLLLAPNGVDLEYFRPAEPNDSEPGAIAFVGLMSYMPNEDAACFFCRDVLPRLADLTPRPHVYLVGRNPSARVKALHDGKNVIVTGEVEDVRPFVSKARLIVVPLRFGGGTRLKILEAFAMRKTVVSTSKGAEGIPARPDQEILIADTADEIERQVRRALASETLRTRLGQAAHHFVRDRFGWDEVQRIVANGYAALSPHVMVARAVGSRES